MAGRVDPKTKKFTDGQDRLAYIGIDKKTNKMYLVRQAGAGSMYYEVAPEPNHDLEYHQPDLKVITTQFVTKESVDEKISQDALKLWNDGYFSKANSPEEMVIMAMMKGSGDSIPEDKLRDEALKLWNEGYFEDAVNDEEIVSMAYMKGQSMKTKRPNEVVEGNGDKEFEIREAIAHGIYDGLEKAHKELKAKFPDMTDKEFYEAGSEAMESAMLHAEFLEIGESVKEMQEAIAEELKGIEADEGCGGMSKEEKKWKAIGKAIKKKKKAHESADPNLNKDAMSQVPDKEKSTKQDTGALKVDNGPSDKDPNLNKDNMGKAPDNPGEVKQGAGSLDKDKNAGTAGDPNLAKDNVAKAGEKAGEPGKQGDSSINKDAGPSAKDPNLNKDDVKKVGDIKLKDSKDPNLSKENMGQEAGSQAPVKQDKSALNVDQNKGKAGDPNLNKDDVAKVGEGKLPTNPAGEVDQKYINDLLEKHGLKEEAGKEQKKSVREHKVVEGNDPVEGGEWFEVFIDKGEAEGTETIANSNSYKGAQEIKADLEKNNSGNKYGIDKWHMVKGTPEPIDDWKPEQEDKKTEESVEVKVVGLTAVPHVAEPKSIAPESTDVIESMRKESESMIIQEGIGLAPKKDGAKGDTPKARIEALAAELAAEEDKTSKKDAVDIKKALELLIAKKTKEFEEALHDMDTAVRDTFIDYYDNFGKDKKALKDIRNALPGWDIAENRDDAAGLEKVIAGLR